MYLDKHLSWDTHIHKLSRSLSRANGILSKLRHNAPISVCMNVYYALFYSHLIYGCSIWGLTSAKNIKIIQTLQKKCVRLLSFSDFKSHTNPLFIDLGLLKVEDILQFHHLKLAYEFSNSLLPEDISNLFKWSRDQQTTNLTLLSNTNNKLALPAIKNVTTGLNSLRFHCASLWNNFTKNKLLSR